MTACSRCGATDDRHSVKCYQAMALGLAMGVEERPAAAGQLAAATEEVRRLRTENEQFRRALDHEGEKLVALQTEVERLRAEVYAPVTVLPPDYYSSRVVTPERLADIEREVAALNESPLLDVTVHDGLNATIRPKQLDRDDDYTPEAIDRQTAAEEADEAPAPEPVAEVAPEPEPTPTEVEEAFHAADMARHEAPEPVVEDTDWPTLVKELRTWHGWSLTTMADKLGCSSTMVSFWEQGKNTPGPGFQDKLRELTHLKPERTPEREVAPEPAADDRDDNTDWAALVNGIRDAYGWTLREMGEVLGCNKSVVGFWGQGKWKPSPEFRAKLRQLADGKRPDRVAESATKIGVPDTRAKPENVAAEEAAQEFVDQCLVAAQGTRRSEDPNQGTFGVYLTAPELLAGYEAWAKANGKPVVPAAARLVGAAAGKSPLVKVKRQGPKHDGRKPMCYFGVKLLEQPQTQQPEAPPEPEPERPSVTPADLARVPSIAEQNRQQVEQMRALMDQVRSVKTEHVPEPAVQIPHGPDEIAIKLAQLKHYGIGGEHGVDRVAAQAAVGDLHPTGRDVWKWSPPLTAGGVSDADLDATAYQLLVKCMNGLPEEFGYDYKDDVLATGGFRQEDVDAALRHPHRVEIRPESWDKEKRYPILGFYRGDVSVILGMLTPAKPRVIAAYWTSLLTADTHRVNKVGGGGARKADGLPTRPSQTIDRLRARGCEIPDPGPDEKPVTVTYKGQELGKITTSRKTSKRYTQSDYQRTVRKMQAIDRREVAKAG